MSDDVLLENFVGEDFTEVKGILVVGKCALDLTLLVD
jgi:hypothetical protein